MMTSLPAKPMDHAKALDCDLGGYRLTKLHTSQGRDGMRFDATITKDGKTFMAVENDGRGGCNYYYGTRDQQAEFRAFAEQWGHEVDYAWGFNEIDDSFVYHLINLAELARMRSVVWMHSDQEPLSDGGFFSKSPTGVTREQVVEAIKAQPGKFPGARVFNKDTWAFEPVD